MLPRTEPICWTDVLSEGDTGIRVTQGPQAGDSSQEGAQEREQLNTSRRASWGHPSKQQPQQFEKCPAGWCELAACVFHRSWVQYLPDET